MIKQNRVWVQSLTLRHTLAATQRRLHPLHHSQTPPPLPPTPTHPFAPAWPHWLTQIQISISWPASHLWPHAYSACAFICQSCESPRSSSSGDAAVDGLPWKTPVDGWFLSGGITPPVCLKTTVVQWIPALYHVLHVDKTPRCTTKYCVCNVALYKKVKLNIKTVNSSEHVSCKSVIHAM